MVHNDNVIPRNAVNDTGPNIRFIYYDAKFRVERGRHFKKNVLEPEPNRLGLVFYVLNTMDKGENKTTLQIQTGSAVSKHSFQGGIANGINKTLEEHPGWQFDPEKRFVNKTGRKVKQKGWIGDVIH